MNNIKKIKDDDIKLNNINLIECIDTTKIPQETLNKIEELIENTIKENPNYMIDEYITIMRNTLQMMVISSSGICKKKNNIDKL